MRLRWKLNPKETGLSAIGAGPRGSILHDGKTKFAAVQYSAAKYGNKEGWFWVAGWQSGVEYKNTCNELCTTVDEAKAQALAYVKDQLKMLSTTPEGSQ